MMMSRHNSYSMSQDNKEFGTKKMTLNYCFVLSADDSIPSSIETSLPISTSDATLEVLLRKLETVEQNQREALILLRANRRGDPGEASVELLQAQTQADLQDLKERLKNRDFTKKMISHLSLVGGSNPGECVRRVLRSVASNFVWSSYSLRGKKGKMPLLSTAVGSTIKQAIMKWKPGLEEKEVELLMAEVLKHAPSAHSKFEGSDGTAVGRSVLNK
ncbi:uncharacterized protein LOC115542615 [Gadus morhua]|uniref:uncharacterized protein LOC115542615 n=1 Tax=Gadus morhua TaxID=8049 RepID=UPI0011B7DAF2|nr:uncharacterized protein LOC115542615 [Gadus morhua]